MKELLKKWAENDFKTDPQLNLIPSLYNKLKNEGHDFTSTSDTVSFLICTVIFLILNFLQIQYKILIYCKTCMVAHILLFK